MIYRPVLILAFVLLIVGVSLPACNGCSAPSSAEETTSEIPGDGIFNQENKKPDEPGQKVDSGEEDSETKEVPSTPDQLQPDEPAGDSKSSDAQHPEPTPESPISSCSLAEPCFQIGKDLVRACEMVFTLPDKTKVTQVSLHPDLRGRSKQAGERLAVVFFWKKNQALTNNSIFQFKLSPKPTKAISWKPLFFQCYDWNGRKIDGVQLLSKEK